MIGGTSPPFNSFHDNQGERTMAILGGLLMFVGAVCGLGSLVCFILILVKMFQKDETTMGIVCIVTIFVCGIGPLIAFVMGWINAAKWQVQQIMVIWTGCFIGSAVLYFIGAAILGASGAIDVQQNMPMQGM
jgi:hypothetical protein